MNEIIIELEEISPKDFFGTHNSNIELLKKYFPKLKIVARGNKIKAYGDEDMLEELADFVARRKAEGGAPTDF